MSTLLLSALFMALFTAGPGHAQDTGPVRLGPVSVVASAGPGFRTFPGVSVALRDRAVSIHLADRFEASGIGSAFREAIMQGLVNRGYRLAPAGESTYEVGFVLALDNSISNAELVERLGFSPGLPSGGEGFERGTLAVLLMMGDSDEVAWRGAIQAFADLDADPTRRGERIRLASERLLRALPEPPR